MRGLSDFAGYRRVGWHKPEQPCDDIRLFVGIGGITKLSEESGH